MINIPLPGVNLRSDVMGSKAYCSICNNKNGNRKEAGEEGRGVKEGNEETWSNPNVHPHRYALESMVWSCKRQLGARETALMGRSLLSEREALKSG